MIKLQIQNVQGKSFNSSLVKKQCQDNISKKNFGGDDTLFDYMNKDGSNNVRFPKSDMRNYMFSQTMRGSGAPSVGKTDSALGMSNTMPLISIYSIQSLHDVFAPGCINRGPGLNDNEVQKERWEKKRDAIQSQITNQYGQLNDSAATIGLNTILQTAKEGEQLVFQQFNHIAVDNMMYQINGPMKVQPSIHSSVFFSGRDQPSLQVK